MPRVPPDGVAQSRPKRVLFEKMGWTEGDPAHTRLYKVMQDEVKRARDKLAMDPESLTSSRRGSPDIHLPYCWDDIQESSKYRAVLEIEKMASDLTRPHYKRASYMDGVNKENWCIQWMLWHSFRLYRQPIMPQVPAASSSPSVEGQDELGTPSTNSSRSSSNTAFACGTAAVMDRPSTSSSSIHSRGISTSSSGTSHAPPVIVERREYWDPVRDV